MKKLALLMVMVMSLCFLMGEIVLAQKKAAPPPEVPQTPLGITWGPGVGKKFLYLGTWTGEMVGWPERGLYAAVGKGRGYQCVKNRYGDFLCFRDIAPECIKTTGMGSVEIAIVARDSLMFPEGLQWWPEKMYWRKWSDEVLLLWK